MDQMIGGKKSYLAMKTDYAASNELISSDLKEVGNAVKKLANHTIKLGALGFGTSFVKWVAAFAAIYLLILDRTNWKTNMLTSLLIPYIYLSLPSWLFNLLSGEVGKWIALVSIVLRLFFPRKFPDKKTELASHAYVYSFFCGFITKINTDDADWLELPAALILLLVVAPDFIANHVRGHIVGIAICLAIGCYLLQEHIRVSGGFRNSFTKSNGISNSVGIILLLVYPVWALIFYFL
ncbi:hypothetical protein RD792_016279 [Penstemon davidsonii]|uniref:Uncharacterized protein n=1 Tax=Penstemon davidsonii TaxID=160366 RepID=A0ABR0CKJ3_9LAMI|nr:hypothetical protein RD792_016279 [Penstemon davidsonii]